VWPPTTSMDIKLGTPEFLNLSDDDSV